MLGSPREFQKTSKGTQRVSEVIREPKSVSGSLRGSFWHFRGFSWMFHGFSMSLVRSHGASSGLRDVSYGWFSELFQKVLGVIQK